MIPTRSRRRAAATRWTILSLFAAVHLLSASALRAQRAVAAVSTSFGVDTTIADVAAIVSVMRAYLAHPDSVGWHSELWSTRDARDRRWGDLTATLAYQGYPATILGVIGTDPGDSLYVVKTLYARADTSSQAIRTLALQRIYAVREAGGWRLSNALPRLTRGWQRLQAGRSHIGTNPGNTRMPPRCVGLVVSWTQSPCCLA